MACPNPADILRAKTEDLGETLYLRASYRSPMLGLIPREEFPNGAGYVRSVFTVGRSEPTTDEETWVEIAPISSDQGPCAVTYNTVEVGESENIYKPTSFGLRGPLKCIEEFVMNWKSVDFWEKYFQALEKRSKRSVEMKLFNAYMQYSYKASCNSSFTWQEGNITTQPFTGEVDTTLIDGAAAPTSLLTQDFLDYTALELIQEGAADGNTNGWITLGESGPEFPLLIGPEASNYILLNNSELRTDYNVSFQGLKESNPVIHRLGASRVIKNFRHVVTPFPPRWQVENDGTFTRVPTWTMGTTDAHATKGKVAILNPDWKDASVASIEAAVVLNPWVMTEEVLRPVGSPPGTKFGVQNYYGEWQFVTGNDAVLGMDSCAGIQDPMHKNGRHFAEYRHALKPIHPYFGRVIFFKRCANSHDLVTCT